MTDRHNDKSPVKFAAVMHSDPFFLECPIASVFPLFTLRTHEAINQPINEAINQPTNRPANQPTDQVEQPAKRPTNQLIKPPNQAIESPTNQPTKQATKQPNRSIKLTSTGQTFTLTRHTCTPTQHFICSAQYCRRHVKKHTDSIQAKCLSPPSYPPVLDKSIMSQTHGGGISSPQGVPTQGLCEQHKRRPTHQLVSPQDTDGARRARQHCLERFESFLLWHAASTARNKNKKTRAGSIRK